MFCMCYNYSVYIFLVRLVLNAYLFTYLYFLEKFSINSKFNLFFSFFKNIFTQNYVHQNWKIPIKIF